MAYILHLETSTKVCSVALSKDSVLLCKKEVLEMNYSHSENLTVFIQDVMEMAQLSLSDLSAIAVSEGPGSYTGLRIGVSTAKGLCFSLNIPLIAIPALQVLANTHLKDGVGYIIPMMDARRNEVFSAVLDNNLEFISPTEAKEVDASFYPTLAGKQIYLVGDGAFKAKSLKREFWNVEDESVISATGMVKLAFNKYLQSDFVDTAYFEPFYLKDFVAGTPKKWFK